MATRHELLIADSTLRDFGGHAYFYDTTVAQAARRYFDDVQIFAHPAFARHASKDYGFRSLRFPPGYRLLERASSASEATAVHSGVFFQALGMLRAALRDATKRVGTFTCLVDVLRRTASGASHRLLLLQYVGISEIAALRALSKVPGNLLKQVRFAFVLRYSPERFLGRNAAHHELLGALLRDERVVVFTDSEPLTAAYRSLFPAARIQTLPVPVAATFQPRSAGVTGQKARRIGFLGATRTEKGFSELPGIIDSMAMQATPDAEGLRFVVQVNPNSPSSLTVAVDRLRTMANAPPSPSVRVEVLDGPLDAVSYVDALVGLDVMLLPYQSDKYEASTSGIFVECLQARVPCVTFRRTWPGQLITQAAGRGLKIGEVIDSIEEIPPALVRMVGGLPLYRRDLDYFANEWLANHSPDAVADRLWAAAGA